VEEIGNGKVNRNDRIAVEKDEIEGGINDNIEDDEEEDISSDGKDLREL
jgi:hypothetical protein